MFKVSVFVFLFMQTMVLQAETKEIVPPPPPGPYRSTALSGFSVEKQSFAHHLNKPAARSDSVNVPMDTFSPDRAWPEQQAVYGYPSAPVASFPARNNPGSTGMPFMRVNPGEFNSLRPYGAAPNYGAGYNRSMNQMYYPQATNQ